LFNEAPLLRKANGVVYRITYE